MTEATLLAYTVVGGWTVVCMLYSDKHRNERHSGAWLIATVVILLMILMNMIFDIISWELAR